MGHVLVILALAVGWVVFVLVSPTRACPCPRGLCAKCKGTGRRFRRGARLVHRGRVLIAERAWKTRDER
jgi:hypothetical protein